MSKMASQAKVLPPIIQDEMQKRRMMKRATTVAKFQTRIFVLYKHQLVYKTKDGKQIRGSVSVLGIKICEDVEDCAFNRPHVFQVGYLEKGKMFHLYIQAKDQDMRENWKFHIRKLCSTYNDHRMQELYHPGHYKKEKWSCCVSDDKNNIGCRQAYRYNDPQPLQSSSSAATSLTLPLTSYHHKTPVLRRTEPRNRVKMPSDCYDSDEMEDALKSPSPSPRHTDKTLAGSLERKGLPSEALLNRPNVRRSSRPNLLPLSFETDQLLQPDSPHDSPRNSPRHSPTTARYKFEHKKYHFLRAQSEDHASHSDDGRAFRNPYARRESLADFRPAYFGKSDDTYLVIRKKADPISIIISEDEGSASDTGKAPLSSSSMRYTSRYAVGRQGSSISGTSEVSTDVGLSMSTPYYCPINTVPIKEMGHSFSISSTRADAGSDRLDSFGAMSHTSRLDSQGSTIGSSICESIPRTESDYQRRVDEEGEGYTGPVYTNSRISKLKRSDAIERDSVDIPGGVTTLDFELELNDERSQSGTYVNTHCRDT